MVGTVSREKRDGFSTSLAIQICRLDFLLDVVLEKGQRTWPQACNFVWS